MGLDNYIVVEDAALYHRIREELNGLSLVRGLVTAEGSHWIRGKVYNELIEGLTGVSLYQEDIDPQTVEKIHKVLQKTKFSKAKRYMGWWEEEDQEKAWEGIQKFFEVCVKYNASLGGWW